MNKNTSILKGEDEMIIAANIFLQLNRLGYEVTEIIPRAKEVLPEIRQHVPDVILMDNNLKGDLDVTQNQLFDPTVKGTENFLEVINK